MSEPMAADRRRRSTSPAGSITADGPAASDDADEAVTRLRMGVLRLARRLRQESPPGITPSQLSALASIARREPITIGDLAACENVQPPTISRIVGALEGEGWVERIDDASDRRVALVQTTPKARRQLSQVRQERNAFLSRRLDGLEPDERAALVAALPALERLLDDDR